MTLVRTATPRDAALLPGIERSAAESFRAIPELAWIAEDEVMPAEAHLPLISQGTVWIAQEEDGGAVGFLAAEGFGAELHIWEISVRGDRQSRGIGRRLLAAAEAHARGGGLAALTLTTFRGVPWNEPFYARLGYRTLDPADGHPRLAEVLGREAARGLPADRRCAMRRILRGPC